MCQAAEKEVQCEKIEVSWNDFKTCYLYENQTIDSRGFLISSTEDHDMQQLIVNSKTVFYFPENIHEKYPNILSISASSSSIKSVLKDVFKNLTKLKRLFLNGNQVIGIENDAFEDSKLLESLGLGERSNEI